MTTLDQFEESVLSLSELNRKLTDSKRRQWRIHNGQLVAFFEEELLLLDGHPIQRTYIPIKDALGAEIGGVDMRNLPKRLRLEEGMTAADIVRLAKKVRQ